MSRLACVLLALTLVGARPAPLTPFDLDRVGHPMPTIAITALDGTPLDLAALRGKPILVALFASWCQPCWLELPWLRAAQAQYGTRVQFVGVDVLDTQPTALAFLTHQALPFRVGFVDETTIDAVSGVDARQAGGMKYRLPALYAVAADGTIVGAWHGVPVQADGTPVDAIPSYLRRLGVDAH